MKQPWYFLTTHRRWFRIPIIVVGLLTCLLLVPYYVLKAIVDLASRVEYWAFGWINTGLYWTRMQDDNVWMQKYYHRR